MTLPPRFTHPPSPQPPSDDGPLISLISATSSEGSPHFLLPPLSPFPPLLLLLLLLLLLAPSLLVLLIVALTATDATVARVALIVVLSP